MISRFSIKFIGKKILLASLLVNGILIEAGEKKYSVAIAAKQSVIGSSTPRYPVFVYPKGKNEAIAWRHFDLPVVSTTWDKARENILHIKLKNGQVHQLDVKQ